MQNNSTTIQYVIIGIFIVFALIGVVIFAGFAPSGSSEVGDERVIVWGLVPQSIIVPVIEQINVDAPNTINMDYIEKKEENFGIELANAIAEDVGPDLVIIPHDMLISQARKLIPIPYSVIPERMFKDTFVEAGEIFQTAQGFWGIPFIIDPIVLYWNRDMFSNIGLTSPPKEWNELTALVPKLVKISGNKTITKSAVSFGEFSNVKNAKEIISTLAMQAGSPMVSWQNGAITNGSLQGGNAESGGALESALSFYTQFSDASRPTYSWNKSLQPSDSMFLRNNSAMYIGFASEINTLRSTNPNLNFDVAMIPQASGTERKMTFARVYGISIVGSSKLKSAALKTITTLLNKDVVGAFSQNTLLPPVRRDLLSVAQDSASKETFYRSAVISKAWLDPNPLVTNEAFKDMIESVTTGRSSVAESTKIFSRKLSDLLGN